MDEANSISSVTACDVQESVSKKDENIHQEMQDPSSRNKFPLSDPKRTEKPSDASLTDSLWSTDSRGSRQTDALLQSWMISKLEEESGK